MNQTVSNTSATHLAQRYIDAWNATDASQRHALVQTTWLPSARYADPLMQGEGHDQIVGLIAAVQERFPGWRFALTGSPDLHGDYLRFSWMLGPVDADGPVKGTDFATLDNGRFSQVVGFLDQLPQGA